MAESLTIKRLGPIDEFVLEPKPLTVIIGEQASGKSLVAQLLFFFRSVKFLIGRRFSPSIISEKNWQHNLIDSVLNDIRGTRLSEYANGTAHVNYIKNKSTWGVKIHSSKGAFPNKALSLAIDDWFKYWIENRSQLGESWKVSHIYIPTERSMLTRLWNRSQSVLFAPQQPLTFRLFAEYLHWAYSPYNTFYNSFERFGSVAGDSDWTTVFDFIVKSQRKALDGEILFSDDSLSQWNWKVSKSKKDKVIPIEAISSGQMEAWPFFLLAATFGALLDTAYFYFEEPETHLHPEAQVEIMRTIGYLVNKGHKFILTTHSPFLLYVINNMIQRHISCKGNFPVKEDIALSPEDVVAYRLGDHPEVISGDKATGLLNLEELEKVADELGGEFDRLLDKMDEAR